MDPSAQLYDAAAIGDAPLVRRLLAQQPQLNPNWRTPSGQTALHIAAAKGNTDAVIELLGCDVVDCNLRDANGCTPLYLACLLGFAGTAVALISRPDRVDATIPDAFGTPVWESKQGIWVINMPTKATVLDAVKKYQPHALESAAAKTAEERAAYETRMRIEAAQRKREETLARLAAEAGLSAVPKSSVPSMVQAQVNNVSPLANTKVNVEQPKLDQKPDPEVAKARAAALQKEWAETLGMISGPKPKSVERQSTGPPPLNPEAQARMEAAQKKREENLARMAADLEKSIRPRSSGETGRSSVSTDSKMVMMSLNNGAQAAATVNDQTAAPPADQPSNIMAPARQITPAPSNSQNNETEIPPSNEPTDQTTATGSDKRAFPEPAAPSDPVAQAGWAEMLAIMQAQKEKSMERHNTTAPPAPAISSSTLSKPNSPAPSKPTTPLHDSGWAEMMAIVNAQNEQARERLGGKSVERVNSSPIPPPSSNPSLQPAGTQQSVERQTTTPPLTNNLTPEAQARMEAAQRKREENLARMAAELDKSTRPRSSGETGRSSVSVDSKMVSQTSDQISTTDAAKAVPPPQLPPNPETQARIAEAQRKREENLARSQEPKPLDPISSLFQICHTGNVSHFEQWLQTYPAEDMNSKTHLGRTPLAVACLKGHAALADRMLRESRVLPNALDQ